MIFHLNKICQIKYYQARVQSAGRKIYEKDKTTQQENKRNAGNFSTACDKTIRKIL